jgi:predicted membrane protein
MNLSRIQTADVAYDKEFMMAWRYLFGFFVLLLGVAFLAMQMGLVSDDRLYTALTQCWPIIVIGIGMNQLFRRTDRPWGSLAVVALGIVLLAMASNHFPSHHHPREMTAFFGMIILAILGLRMVLPRRTRQESYTAVHGAQNKAVRFAHTLKEFQLISGVHFHNDSQQFKGGQVSTIFGEYEIDLRGAALAHTGGELILTAIFGNIAVRVPEHMTIEVSGTPMLGSIDNLAKQIVPIEQGRPILKLRCTSVLSAIEITN